MRIPPSNSVKSIFCLAAAISILGSCGFSKPAVELGVTDSYYIIGSSIDREILRDLLSLLKSEQGAGEERFVVVREFASELLRLEKFGKLTHFLSGWVSRHPDDPYNAYFLFMIAYVYLQQDAAPVAAYYFDRIVKNYPDLMVRGESVHLACLKKLIELVEEPEQRVWYYKELISRFSESIDLGAAYFQLAQAYERIGEWDAAIKTYTKFLPFFETSIPGFPDAFGYARKLVDFNNSPKDWSYENLGELVESVQKAMDQGNAAGIRRYRAKVNFFAMSWEQEEQDANSQVEFSFSDFMFGNRIRYAPSLDSSSNANEAYLKTWGWSQRISTWYLYFRKINFPADPEIHGRWEWAGIYYGEKF